MSWWALLDCLLIAGVSFSLGWIIRGGTMDQDPSPEEKEGL